MIVINSEISSEDKQIGEAANEFFAAIARGEEPSISQFTERYPEIAEHIRRTFPALLLVGSCSTGGKPNELQPQSDSSKTLGDFRLIRELGRGGMGTVFEAEQVSMGRRVALKVLPFAALVHESSLQRFRNEVRAAAALNHPHIVPVYSIGEERGVHFYAMQLIRGGTLADLIGQRCQDKRDKRQIVDGSSSQAPTIDSAVAAPPSTKRDAQGRISTAIDSRRDVESYRSAARLGIQAAEALQHAHDQGVLHRDIKPSNLMLDREGKLFVTDFGLARMEADAGMTMTGDILGTLRYMAPEQALAKRVVIDHRADVYSLGATLYELVALQPAFGETDRAALLKQIAFEAPQPLRKLDRQIPPELETIVFKAMAKSPDERYQAAQQLADDLRAYLENRPIQAKPPTLVNRAAKWSRRHHTLVSAAALVLMLLTAFLAVGMAVVKRAQTQAVSAFKETSDLLYMADMTVALQNFENDWSDEVRPILDRHRPKAGEPDRRGWEWYLLQSLTRPPTSLELVGHERSVNEIAIFPDRQRLASVGDDGTLRVWDLRSQKQLKALKLGDRALHSVAVSPDGRFVAAGSNTVYLCDLAEGDRLKEIFHSEHNFESLAFRPDGACIAAGSRYHDVFLISLEGKLIGRTQCDSRVMSLEFLAKEHLLLLPNRNPKSATSSVGVAQLWRDDLSTLQQDLGHASDGIGGHITIARSWPGGHYVLAGESYGSRSELFERDTGRVVESTHQARGKLCDLAISPDGQAAAFAYDNGIAEYYQASSLKGIFALSSHPIVFKAHEGEVSAVRFVSPNQLATCGADGFIRVWSLAEIPERTHVVGSSHLCNIDLSPDGALVLYVGLHGYNVFESLSGDIVSKGKIDIALSGGTAWSPTGNKFAVCLEPSEDRPVRIFDRSGNPLCSIAHPGSPYAVAFSPDGQLIGVIGDQQLQICSAESGEEVARQSLAGPGQAVAFSHDGRRIAYSGTLKQVVLSSVPMLSDKTALECRSETNCMAFTPDDSTLATGHDDGSLRLWDTATGKMRTELKGYEQDLLDVAFSPDGHTLLTATSVGAVRIWSVDQERSYGLFCQTYGPNVAPSQVKNFRMSMSADGKHLAVGYANPIKGLSYVRIFDIQDSTQR